MNPGLSAKLQSVFGGLALLLLPACGGGSSHGASASAYATTLAYTNPSSSGYTLQVASGNNTGHLVLNLVGPAGVAARGVSFFLSADPAMVTWSMGTGTPSYATAGTVFTLGAAPQAFVTSRSATGDLQVGLFQKSGSATYGSAPILSVALDLASTTLKPGSTVTLAVTPNQQAMYVDGNGAVQSFPAPIAIGTLTAN
jgi:hypothetical protein